MNKYLFLYRRPEDSYSHQPSPDEMQAIFKAWSAWKEKFKNQIVDMGDGLNPGGRVLKGNDQVTDGPFVEAKEVLGGYSIVQTKSYDEALDVARECPFRETPGASIEVREMAGYA